MEPGGAWPGSVRAAAQVFVEDLETPETGPEDGHHLARVLRLRAGETVVAADGAGHWRACRYGPGGRLEPVGDIVSCTRPAPEVTVGFVPVKGDRPEWVVQKLTELGVDRIVVLTSARAVVRWEGDREGKALDRLRRVSREGAAQSRRPWTPSVTGVGTLADLAGELAGGLALAQPGGPAPGPGLTGLAVGPEGGWGEAELELGLPAVGLGPGVLRAETAAVAAGFLLCGLRDRVIGPA